MRLKLVLLTLAFLISKFSHADEIKLTYTFEQPKFEKKGEYTTIQYQNCRNFGPEGAPSMPHFAAEVLLPAGHEISKINVEDIIWYEPYGSITISPAARQFPLSHKYTTPYVVKADDKIYSMKGSYPANMVDHEITQYLSGHAIGGFTICPVIYHPSKNKIELVKSITLTIETSETPKAKSSIGNLKSDESILKRVKKLVDNPENLDWYTYAQKIKVQDEVDMLIVTSQDLMNGFDDLINYKRSSGFIVDILVVDDIYAEYGGRDDSEKIRNCIIDYYQNKNLKYVILGGDADGNEGGSLIVPTRGMYGVVNDAYIDYSIPTDMYFSNLDGSWDSDGDGIFGEIGEEDLFAEVYVGRMCVDNTEELANIINKTILYQKNPVVEDIEKALMVAEILNVSPIYGGDAKDEIAFGSTSHGFSTVGISDNFTITRLYDRDGGWNHSDVYNQINVEGVNLLNHLGHSSPTYNMTMLNSDITTANFRNNGIDRGFIIDYSQGCYSGAFDNKSFSYFINEDCFAEEFASFENGAVACIQNSRYGWGDGTSTGGASQYYDRQFFDAIFGESITNIGEANADSKSDNIAYIDCDNGAMRWTAYGLNLFGDPSLDIWTAQPTNFIVNYNETMNFGSSHFEANAGIADARIALIQDDQLIGRACTDESGSVMIETFEPVSSQKPINITITGHNKKTYQGTIIVLDDGPYIGMYDYEFIGSPNYGETINMNAKFKNFADNGSTNDAHNVTAKLRTSDKYISINDSIVYLGDIIAGDSAIVLNAFSFSIHDSVPDGHIAYFSVVISDEGANYEWTSSAQLILNAPKLVFGELFINDDGVLDPGDTAELKVVLENDGHASISNVNSTISIISGEEYVTLLSSEFSVGNLNIGESKVIVFNAVAHESVTLGTPIHVVVSAGEVGQSYYGIEEDMTILIGFVPEYCESRAMYNSFSDLTSFSFGQLENNSEGDNGTYDDYTTDEDLVLEFMPGATYDISITISSLKGGNDVCAKVFVDWNYDGDFVDLGENIFEVFPQSESFTEKWLNNYSL
jgi:hypothetical protein